MGGSFRWGDFLIFYTKAGGLSRGFGEIDKISAGFFHTGRKMVENYRNGRFFHLQDAGKCGMIKKNAFA